MTLCAWRQGPPYLSGELRAGPNFKEGRGAVSQAWKGAHYNPTGSVTIAVPDHKPGPGG